MKLRLRLLIFAAIAAVPVAVLIYMVNEHLRTRDARLALDRFVTSQLTDDTREKCDTNANWFLAGPRPARPTKEQMAALDADVTAPRPTVQELPVDFFAYDQGLQPLSTAGPRFPTDLRNTLRGGAKRAFGTFPTKIGTGQQVAVMTEWEGTNCAVLLYRMWPVPNQTSERATIVVSLIGLLLLVGLIPGVPIITRVQKLATEAKHAADDEYKSTVEVGGKDEMSSIAFAFNEASAQIRQRSTDVKDREDSLQRYMASVNESVATIRDPHTLAMRLHNLAVAASLKASLESPAADTVDLGSLLQRVIERQRAFAQASNVRIETKIDSAPIAIAGNTMLLEQAVNNLVDNAIRYNRSGGQVIVSLDRTRDGRFSLRVSDDGPGAPDDVLAKLNANHRFRGDEGRAGVPGGLGLGLAVVREVADRLGIRWVFRRSAKGWFEAELNK